MSGLMNLVLTVQVICAIGIIVLVLLQQGKGSIRFRLRRQCVWVDR
ncbi:MAG: hypothetical protein RLZZ140_178 [Pseudomonadota bacterium]